MTPVPWATLQRFVATRRRLVAAALAGLAVLCGLAAVRPPAPPSVLVLAAARDLPAGAALTLADLRSVALPAGLVPDGALRPGAAVLGRLVAGPVRAGEPLTDVRLVGPGLVARLAPGSVAVPVRFADAGAVALLRSGDRIDVLAASGAAGDTALADPALADAALAGPTLNRAPPDPKPAAGDAHAARGEATTAARGAPADPGVTAGPADAADPAGPAAPAGPAGPVARVVASDVVVLAVPAADPNGLADGALVVLACSPAVARALAAAAATDRLSPALRAAGPPGGPP